MNKVKLTLWIFLVFFIIQSCKQGKGTTAPVETPESGMATIGVDESLQPIVDQEIYVFTHLNDSAKLRPVYGPENTVLRLLLNDSLRIAVLSRDLNADEKKMFAAKNMEPVIDKFAIDAVTLIVNQASKDTLITINELKKMLAGQTKTGVSIVLDNANSSLARYLKDFAGVNDLKQKNIYSVKNNKEVIKYVDQHPNSIGITGLSWLNDPDDDYAEAVKDVKVMAVRDDNSKTAPTQYFTPSQNTLMLKQYPLIRGLYIINCTGKMGVGRGFNHFILSDRGQRIILRSNILPEIIPEREIHIKHNN